MEKDVIKLIISEGVSAPNGLKTQGYVQYCIDSPSNGPCNKAYIAKIRAVLKKLPGFLFSGYEQTQLLGMAVTTMDTMHKLMMDYFKQNPWNWRTYNQTIRDKNFSHGVQKERLLIQLAPSATKEDIEVVTIGLMFSPFLNFRNYVKNGFTTLINTRNILSSMEENLDLLVIFLIIVSVIAITLAFFLLLLSNMTNIRENVWEFGILRYSAADRSALGLSKQQIVRVYLYESFAVMTSSMLLGLSIGLLVSVASGLQSAVFLEVPYKFNVRCAHCSSLPCCSG